MNLQIRAHDGDVNAVAFADKTSQILFSGGDDGLCKVGKTNMKQIFGCLVWPLLRVAILQVPGGEDGFP